MRDDLLETNLRRAVPTAAQRAGLTLVELHPGYDCHEHPLTDLPWTIGRDPDCRLHFDDSSVSRHHARIEQQDGGLVALDLQSTNGTFINRRRLGRAAKPLVPGSVLRLGDHVLQLVRRSPDAVRDEQQPSPLVGGAGLAAVRRQIRLLGPTPLRIMVTGQSGTGKELVARELHRCSDVSGPLIAVNCAALPESLVEAELFGHVRGAFTGADRDKPGLFEAARGGTLFLDEVTELPLPSQAKLLRVVETKELRRVGSVQSVRTDCRIISATNHDLQRDIDDQRFRGDLAARLAETEIRLPPLRERIEDLPLLLAHLAQRAGCRLGLTADVVEVLACYSWPLNVRELDNTVRMLDVLAQGREVTLEMLPQQLLAQPGAVPRRATSSKAERVLQALRDNGGNIRQTSKQLGVSRSFVYRCLDRSGIDPASLRPDSGHRRRRGGTDSGVTA